MSSKCQRRSCLEHNFILCRQLIDNNQKCLFCKYQQPQPVVNKHIRAIIHRLFELAKCPRVFLYNDRLKETQFLLKIMKGIVLIGCLARAFKKTIEEKRLSIHESTKQIKG